MQLRHASRADAVPSFPRAQALFCATVIASILLSLGGCPSATRNNIPSNLIDVDRVVNDDTLTPQERRERLSSMGLTALAINAVMREERLANQFGGTLRSAFVKVVDGFFQNLSPDEIQIFGDEATAVDSTVSADLSDSEAQAVQTLFRQHGIDNADQLEDFLADPILAAEVPEEISDGVLMRLFVDFDPETLRERL